MMVIPHFYNKIFGHNQLEGGRVTAQEKTVHHEEGITVVNARES